MREVPYQDGMKTGFGFNLLTGEALPTPAVTGSTSAIAGAAGQQVTTQILEVDDLETLHTSLGISVDAGGSYFGFGGDAKVDFVKECGFTQFSTYVLVSVSVQDAFESFDSPVLSPDASDLIAKNNRDRFRQRFGDVFISGLKKGGEYHAIYEISGSDKDERQSVAVMVQASFNDIVAAAHLDSNVNSKTQSSSSHLQVKTHVFQQGSIDKTDRTLADVMTKAQNFPPSVAGNLAYPYAVSLSDYSALKLPNDSFNAVDIENQRQVLQDLAKKRFAFMTRGNDIDYILAHPDDFENADPASLRQMHDKVINAINTMTQQASACSNNPAQCTFTLFDINDYPIPNAKPGKAPIKTPSFIGLPFLAAREFATKQGLSLAPTFLGGPSPGDPLHNTLAWVHWTQRMIQQQDPAADTPIKAGSTVKVTCFGLPE